MKNSLPTSEWVFVSSLLLLMGALVLIAKINTHRMTHVLQFEGMADEKVFVTIGGAVTKPGKYTVRVGTILDEVVQRARPKPWANLDEQCYKFPVNESQYIEVKELSEIKVFVGGEVELPQEIILPAKSRISDLRSKVIFTQDTDKSYFKRKRMLKNGEHIQVPKKKLEENRTF